METPDVRKLLIVLAFVCSILAVPAYAQAPSTLDRVLSELAALSKRVDKLEQNNAALVSENVQLRQRNERLEAATAELQASTADTRKTLADTAPRVATLEKSAAASGGAEWANRIAWKGDFRYRHEQVQPEESTVEQKRQRIRARFGFTAKLSDTLATTVALATNGGGSDPRSTNQSLGDGLTRKGIGLDLAYVDWKPVKGVGVQFGKTPYPWQRVGSYLWDPDITWEGASVRVEHGSFFASGMGSWLSESASITEGTLFGAQVGWKHDYGTVKVLGAVNYIDVGGLQGEVTTAATGCTVNSAFFGGPQGNTTFTDGLGCTRLMDDFNIVEALGQAEFKLGHVPVVVFGDFLRNQEASDHDTGYSVGFGVGKAADPHSWEFGYAWQSLEKDAQFGQFADSDFGGGITDTKGSVFKFAYAPVKSWTVNATYFLNQRFVDVGTKSDYDRWQLDLLYKF
jgi:cell division protein FtsB